MRQPLFDIVERDALGLRRGFFDIRPGSVAHLASLFENQNGFGGDFSFSIPLAFKCALT